MLMSGRTWLDVPHDLQGVRLLPEVLREAGYVTFATGKWHNGEPSFVRAFPRGSPSSSAAWRTTPRSRSPTCATARSSTAGSRRSSPASSSPTRPSTSSSRDPATEPFFCYVAFTAPHDPRNPPEPYREMYYRNRPPLPQNFLPQHPFDNGMTKDIRDENLAPYPRTREVIGDQLCEYYGLITHLDEQVGRILAALEAVGARGRDTIIIYTADHGLALGSHGLLGKQSLYEHSMRSPLIIAGPGIPAGRSTAAFTYLFDLFPTICDLAGVKPPDGLAGRDLRPLWDGRECEDPRVRVPPVQRPDALGARRALEAHRLPADQPPPVVRPAGRPPRDAGPRRRPRARAGDRSADRPDEILAGEARR